MLESYAIFEASLGVRHDRTSGIIQHLIDLYDAWHEVAPDAGPQFRLKNTGA